MKRGLFMNGDAVAASSADASPSAGRPLVARFLAAGGLLCAWLALMAPLLAAAHSGSGPRRPGECDQLPDRVYHVTALEPTVVFWQGLVRTGTHDNPADYVTWRRWTDNGETALGQSPYIFTWATSSLERATQIAIEMRRRRAHVYLYTIIPGSNTYSLQQSLSDMGASPALRYSAASVEEWIFATNVPRERILQVEHFSVDPPETQPNPNGNGELPPMAERGGYLASSPGLNATRVPVYAHRNRHLRFQLPVRLDPVDEEDDDSDPDDPGNRIVAFDLRNGIGNHRPDSGCSR